MPSDEEVGIGAQNRSAIQTAGTGERYALSLIPVGQVRRRGKNSRGRDIIETYDSDAAGIEDRQCRSRAGDGSISVADQATEAAAGIGQLHVVQGITRINGVADESAVAPPKIPKRSIAGAGDAKGDCRSQVRGYTAWMRDDR